MRRQAREVVYKLLFSELFNSEEEDALFNELTVEEKLGNADIDFAKKLYDTIKENKDYLDSAIGSLAKNYKLDRIYPTDRCALLIGFCEIKFFDDVPNIVAIDEALSLCRIYSTATSLGFVNGIFAEFKKKVESGEEFVFASPANVAVEEEIPSETAENLSTELQSNSEEN